jgi:hypothetical protein
MGEAHDEEKSSQWKEKNSIVSLSHSDLVDLLM